MEDLRPDAHPLCYELLEPERELAGPAFEVIQSYLDLVHGWNIGWHYAVDLAWIQRVTCEWPRGTRVLDAGGGCGPAQYLLLERGYDVTNVDLAASPPTRFERRRYGATYEKLPSFVDAPYSGHLASRAGSGLGTRLRRNAIAAEVLLPVYRELRQRARTPLLSRNREAWRARAGVTDRRPGRLRIVRGNLGAVPELASGAFDAVVSLSALEHIPLDALDRALEELRRLVGPRGAWAVTTSATEREETWFHEPSQGLCFSAEDLATRFRARPARDQSAAEVLEAYRRCRFLEARLAPAYARSGHNGMPWGRWAPAYVPVGIHR
jgi:SAM-dependent methyltransferase